MPVLHTVNKSPYGNQALSSCLRLALPGSHILLLEDGVYAALAGHGAERPLCDYLAHSRVHVLDPDLEARGLSGRNLLAGIARVDYPGFVELCVASSKVVAWF